ncbi:uncharacterized protein N7503_005913 [Penicillium pulvis]|uniref:uncharacterized protein n=1 Tax=Penicillium pulvis TaxID=1562058 RepID=UPI0025491A51|nr:uncharacterized protein N7503_005913 [Penicillium pulvis]KAJ5803463.1 hypothetical protein N7503_005913 [Penicillium pulvis]
MNPQNRGYEQVWQEAMKQCRVVLGDDDYNVITEFNSPDQLKDAISQLKFTYSTDSSIVLVLSRMLPQLQGLNTFITVILLSIGPNNLTLACIWGAINLLIQLASQSERALNEIVTLLGGIQKSLTLFDLYAKDVKLDAAFLDAVFDILVELMTCSALAIRHFRMHVGNFQPRNAAWDKIRGQFTKVLTDIADKAEFLRSISEAQSIKGLNQSYAEVAQKLEDLTFMQAKLAKNTVSLPCQTLPFSRNPSFYGRTEILKQITDALATESGSAEVRSVALWGTGGIGKTQIALEYAFQQVSTGCQIVLWIACEKETEIANSFNKAAQKLQLPGVLRSNTPDRNRDLVLEYLQKTDVKWLLVFDNVEGATEIQKIWPAHGHGSIVVTCRSEFVVEALVNDSMEIPMFSKEEGRDFILSSSGQKKNVSPADLESALTLSNMLGGLALALELVGKQAKIRRKTLAQFMPFYNENRAMLHKQPKTGIKNPYYQKDLESVWKNSFDVLTDPASRLMMLFGFLAPTDIPERILSEGKNLPTEYSFLNQMNQYDEAKLELADLSLISLNGEASLISVHRLIQQAYINRMSEDDYKATFKVVVDLLQGSFSRDAGRHLYTRWELCSSLIQHVQAFAEMYDSLGGPDLFQSYEPLTYLIQNAAWYLQETGAFKASERLINVAFSNCVDRNSMAYADLIDTAGTIHDRQGHAGLALSYFEDSLKIHEAKSPPGSVQLSNAYSAVGVELTASWRPLDALEFANKAISGSPSEHAQKLKLNPDRYLRNRGRSYYVAEKYEDAKADFKEAEYWQTLIHGENSHYHGETAYMFGKVAAAEGELDEAYGFLQRAVDLMAEGKPTHISVGAARFQQGCVRMRQGQDAEALRLFRDALTICQTNEGGKGTQADSARVKWRMSQVMEREGREAEAKAYREAAEKSKIELLATGLFAQGSGEEQNYDSLIGLLYR